MVGTGRFELPTPRTPSECSTRLSHVPTEEGSLPEFRRVFGARISLSLTGAALCFALWRRGDPTTADAREES